MAIKKKKGSLSGQRRTRPISQRGKGENRIAMERSRSKSEASGYKAPKKRTGINAAAKKAVAGRKAGMGGTGSTLKTQAKQKLLNVKGKSKAVIRNAKAGKYKMTAAHKKAISDALKGTGSRASGAVAGAKKKFRSLFKRKK